jgi:two-component system sensor histidine kinase KdpD
MANVESKLRRDTIPMSDADPLPGSAPPDSPTVVGYLASFAMAALATFVAVGIDHEVTIPNLSLIFVVPVIIAGLAFGLGSSLCAALLGALAYDFFLT